LKRGLQWPGKNVQERRRSEVRKEQIGEDTRLGKRKGKCLAFENDFVCGDETEVRKLKAGLAAWFICPPDISTAPCRLAMNPVVVVSMVLPHLTPAQEGIKRLAEFAEKEANNLSMTAAPMGSMWRPLRLDSRPDS
jgi:hypothetical protein